MNIDPISLNKRGLIFNGRHLPYNPNLKEKARKLRKNMTLEEKKLWFNYLKKLPQKFKSQQIIDNFIVDFYCPKCKLVIELDGNHHYNSNQKEYDKKRTNILKCYNVKVIRFSNNNIRNNFHEVCEYIDLKLKE